MAPAESIGALLSSDSPTTPGNDLRPHPETRTVVTDAIQIHEYENGLALVTQRMDWVESAAFSLLVPAGCSRDPRELLGLANITCEMVQRGCGTRDSRQFVNDLENLGVDHSSSVSIAHTSFGGAMPAERIEEALAIHADLVQRPHLPADQLEDARLACIQEIRALEDDLAQRAMQELRRRRYGDPFGRNNQGTLDSHAAHHARRSPPVLRRPLSAQRSHPECRGKHRLSAAA